MTNAIVQTRSGYLKPVEKHRLLPLGMNEICMYLYGQFETFPDRKVETAKKCTMAIFVLFVTLSGNTLSVP